MSAHGRSPARPSAPPTFAAVESLVRRAAAPMLGTHRLDLVSVTRTSDGRHVALECATDAADDAATALARELDPGALGAAPGAAVVLTFVRAGSPTLATRPHRQPVRAAAGRLLHRRR